MSSFDTACQCETANPTLKYSFRSPQSIKHNGEKSGKIRKGGKKPMTSTSQY